MAERLGARSRLKGRTWHKGRAPSPRPTEGPLVHRPLAGAAGPAGDAERGSSGPPPRPFALSGWALLPLRAFLGFTFSFAGLQKLANPNFFNANSPSSIQSQLIASIRISPLHPLLGHLLRFAVPIGVLIALAELAVGLGALLGLWTRLAAAGGMLLSLTLFLTVSFHSSPYYTGADIVFLFAWIPLLLAGSGGVLSLDAVIAARVATERALGPATVVPVRFDRVQQVCGNYVQDTCSAQAGRRCDVVGCPFLADERVAVLRRSPDAVDRRTVVLGGTAVAASAVVGGVVAAATAGLGRAVGGAKSPGADATASSRLPREAEAPAPRPPPRRPVPAPPSPRRPARRSAWPARCPSAAPRPSRIRPRATPASSSSS